DEITEGGREVEREIWRQGQRGVDQMPIGRRQLELPQLPLERESDLVGANLQERTAVGTRGCDVASCKALGERLQRGVVLLGRERMGAQRVPVLGPLLHVLLGLGGELVFDNEGEL